MVDRHGLRGLLVQVELAHRVGVVWLGRRTVDGCRKPVRLCRGHVLVEVGQPVVARKVCVLRAYEVLAESLVGARKRIPLKRQVRQMYLLPRSVLGFGGVHHVWEQERLARRAKVQPGQVKPCAALLCFERGERLQRATQHACLVRNLGLPRRSAYNAFRLGRGDRRRGCGWHLDGCYFGGRGCHGGGGFLALQRCGGRHSLGGSLCGSLCLCCDGRGFRLAENLLHVFLRRVERFFLRGKLRVRLLQPLDVLDLCLGLHDFLSSFYCHLRGSVSRLFAKSLLQNLRFGGRLSAFTRHPRRVRVSEALHYLSNSGVGGGHMYKQILGQLLYRFCILATHARGNQSL